MDDLINKKVIIPEVKLKRFDNSNEYTIIKKTKKGAKVVLKPELVREIEQRLRNN